MKNRNSRSVAKRFKGRGAFTKKGIKKGGYVRIGKELAELHLAYEQEGDPASIGLEIRIDKPDYTVEKMQFKKEGKTVHSGFCDRVKCQNAGFEVL